MIVQKSLRSWLAGMTCLSLAFVGCAAPSGVGTPGALSQGPTGAANRGLKDPQRLHLTHAQLQEQLGNPTSARQSYEIVLQKNKESIDAIVGLARLDQLAGRFEEAELGLLKALEIDPNSTNALASAGQFYATQERWDEAIKMLRAAMALTPENKTFEYNLALFLARSGDIAGARPHFVRTVGAAESHYNVGYILKESGDLPAAEQEFLQALVKNPDLNNAKVLLGEIRQQRQAEIALTGGQTEPAGRQAQAAQAVYQSAQRAAPAIQAGHSVSVSHSRLNKQSTVTADARILKMEVSRETTTDVVPDRAAPASINVDSKLSPKQREQLMNQLRQ